MGLFSNLSAKLSEMRQRSRDKKEFFTTLLSEAATGKLTDSEMKQLEAQYHALGLTPNDLKNVRAQAYCAALRAAESGGVVTAEEELELGKLQQFLMIPDAEIASSKRELAKLRFLSELKNGTPPPAISVQNVILQRGETAYWSEPASLLEDRVVSRRYEGGSQGLSFRIMKGVTYRVGAYRGHLVSDKAVLPVSSGNLIITNRRVIFQGDSKSFAFSLNKMLELHLYSDGIRLTDDRGKPRLVHFAQAGNADVVGNSFVCNQPFHSMTANLTVNRTRRFMLSTWRASRRRAGYLQR